MTEYCCCWPQVAELDALTDMLLALMTGFIIVLLLELLSCSLINIFIFIVVLLLLAL